MQRDERGDLAAFLAVAEERSFTRAAVRLGTSQSALSQTVRRLEARLGLKLLARTTRSVSPTEAGQQLLETLGPALGEISARLAALGRLRETPAGLVRITCSRHAAETVLWPAIDRVLGSYPEIQVELSIDGALTNIVTDRFDAGVRLGEQVEKDMIAVRIGPDLRMTTRGNLYAWEFAQGDQALNVRVDGALIVNDMATATRAAAAAAGHLRLCDGGQDQCAHR